ncbi:MAG: hypothetical protein C3F06_03190 [Candidatus Methanoperedenaceae archaeon]|nr:MAG: hypothetical protein C3F06_03190 [Candidatus Methanoperedenaceae archaeon]
MNSILFKFTILLVIVAVSGCVQTPVKMKPINNSQILVVESGDESIKQELSPEWEILEEGVPLDRGIDFYKNAGYGETKVTFEYSPGSGMGTLIIKKNEDDWMNKSKADYHISGIRLLLKKGSGEVYDTGMIVFQKGAGWTKSISIPKEKFVRFKVEEIEISP